jgi:hypothetical protein
MGPPPRETNYLYNRSLVLTHLTSGMNRSEARKALIARQEGDGAPTPAFLSSMTRPGQKATLLARPFP